MLTIINLIFSISCLFPDFLFDHQQSASGAGDNRFFELSNCSLYFLLSFYIFKSFFIFYFGQEGDMEEAMGCATGAGDNWLFELSNCSFYFG